MELYDKTTKKTHKIVDKTYEDIVLVEPNMETVMKIDLTKLTNIFVANYGNNVIGIFFRFLFI